MSELEHALTSCNAAVRRLRSLHDELGSWAKVGAAVGISGGMAFRVAEQGYQPRDPEIRLKLELPLLSEKLCAELLKDALRNSIRAETP